MRAPCIITLLSLGSYVGGASAFVPSRTAGAPLGPATGSHAISTLPQADLTGKAAKSAVVGSALTEHTQAAVERRGGARDKVQEAEAAGASKLLVGFYFALWYALNILYNITNKKALNAISLPWVISTSQLVVGSIFIFPIWLLKLRDAPGLSKANIEGLFPIALCHMLSHVCAVVGLGAGAVSFVHIVKAGEPLFTALFSAVFLGQVFSPLVYLTLIPVVAGVSIASLNELDFKWAALGGAMGSNLAASSRAILSKRRMGMDMGRNMTPANMYAVLTIMATVMLLPLAILVEGPKAVQLWEKTVTDSAEGKFILVNTILSGICFYLYNEVAFRCLGVVHPVTHAVGNTFKRVFLIATSIIVFKSKLTPMSAFGSFMAIAGVLLYSLTKEWTQKQAAMKAHASR